MLDQTLLLKRQPRLPSLFWLAIAVVIFMAVSAWIAWQLYAKPYDDLPTFYWATRLAFDQELSAYQPIHFQELGQALHRKIYPFLYPPPSLLLFSPALLCADYEQCKIIFSVFNLLLWWVVAWTLCSFYSRCIEAHHKSLLMCVLIVLFTLVYAPLTDTLKNGQVNLIVLLCLMPVLFAPASREQQVFSGLLLACAIILKVYVLLLLPAMLIFGRWREVMTSAAFLALLIIASVVLLPQSMWREWFELSSNVEYGKGIPQVLTIPFNQSANGFLIRHFLDQRGAGQPMDWIFWAYGFTVLCVSAVIYVVLKYLRHWQAGYPITLALVLLLINLTAPLTWLHHYVFALPAIVCVIALIQNGPRAGRNILVTILFLVALGLLAAPFTATWWFSGILSQPGPGESFNLAYNLMFSTPLVAATTIFVIFMCLIIRRG